MDEQAGFEARAVLAPRRARLNRLALILPAAALVALALAGFSGARSDQAAASVPVSTLTGARAPAAIGSESGAAAADAGPQYPARIFGLDVQRLGEVGASAIGQGELRAVAGWYLATKIIDCPPLAASYRAPNALGNHVGPGTWAADSWAYCDRLGLLYATRPDLEQRAPTNNLEDNRSKNAGLPVVPVAIAFGVVVMPELEVLGGDATPVVIIGHLDDTGADCSIPARCGRALVVDHVAWVGGT